MQMPASHKPAETSASTTLTGIVSDAMGGAHHMPKDKSAAECTRICVKQGTKYALVVGKKVYTLEGHEAELDKVAGTKATVKGKVSGETLTRYSRRIPLLTSRSLCTEAIAINHTRGDELSFRKTGPIRFQTRA
jgi:hypothetical protein